MNRLIFRILFSLIFIVAGAGHLLSPDGIVRRLQAAPGAFLVEALPPKLVVFASGGVLLIGGLALLTGLLTRWAAVALAAVLIPITLTVQVGGGEMLGPLFKNVALMGGLLHFATEGGGRFSLDTVMGRLKSRRLRAGVGGAMAASVLVLLLPALHAEAASPKDLGTASQERIFFLVQQPPQLRAALHTSEEALAGRGFPAKEAEVLVCGPAITSLMAGEPMEPLFQRAKQAGVRIVACGLSLKEKGLSAERLSPHVTVVENGLVQALQRQKEGFRSVEL